MKQLAADAIELAGFALCTYGAYELRTYAGIIVGGLFLILIANNINKGSA